MQGELPIALRGKKDPEQFLSHDFEPRLDGSPAGGAGRGCDAIAAEDATGLKPHGDFFPELRKTDAAPRPFKMLKTARWGIW